MSRRPDDLSYLAGFSRTDERNEESTGIFYLHIRRGYFRDFIPRFENRIATFDL